MYIQETRRSAREHEEQKEVRLLTRKLEKLSSLALATPSDSMTVSIA